MRKKNFLFPSLLGCAVLGLALKGLASRFTRAKSMPGRPPGALSFDEIDTFVEKGLKHLNVPGASLAVVEGERIVHVRGFGQACPGGEAPTPQTPFFIGSLTKSFTALAVMQLVEAGKIELDAPVQRYLPWFCLADPQASAQMTVRHLLNQTSGLPESLGLAVLAEFDDRPAAAERQARSLSSLKLTRPVGSAFEYSNLNYNLLGLIIEAASGEAYPDYLQNHILNPLALSRTFTSPPAARKNGLATGHRYWFWSPIPAPNLSVPRASLASGQLISTAEDLALYQIALLNGGRCGGGQILSTAGIAELHKGAAEIEKMGKTIGKYAMGWFVSGAGPAQTIWHSGCVPNFTAYMALLPGQKKSLVLLVNAGHYMMNPTLIEFGLQVTALLAGQKKAEGSFGFTSFVPWAMRGLLLIPLLQIFGVAATLVRLRRWRQDPGHRPGQGRLWAQHILLPLLPNLSLAAVPVYLLANKMLRVMLLFAPDISWLALLSGAFAAFWTFLRTALTLRILRPPSIS